MTTKITDKNISNIANKFIQWQPVVTADGSTSTTTVAGRGYFIDTTSNAHTIILPSSASNGDAVAIKDYAGTFATNNLTVNRNGHNIQGAANNSLLSTNRASVILVYVDATKGWVYTKESNVGDLREPTFISATGGTITTSGNDKIHSFTGDGSFVVSQIGLPIGCNGGPSDVDYLVVAGGGAGAGSGGIGGGGGAGGYRASGYGPSPLRGSAITLSAQTYPITVGGGAAGYHPAYSPGSFDSNASGKGSNSVFSTITSTGGGGGGVGGSTSAPGHGGPGGSGGGGNGGWGTPGGNGNTPPVSPPQGNNGGNANDSSSSPLRYAGGGGGGAGAVGSNGAGAPRIGGAGGSGVPNNITGSGVNYAGGGGAGGSQGGGTGGSGGGGDGTGCGSPTGSQAAGANTGGGGGGGGNNTAGSGGKGIVIIRYKYQ